MPRSKANETIIHRVELGSWERSRAEAMIDAFIFNRVGTPIVAAMSDVSFMIMLGSLLAAWKLIDKETWDALTGSYQEGVDTISDVIGWGQQAYDAGQFIIPGGEDPDFWDALQDFTLRVRGRKGWRS